MKTLWPWLAFVALLLLVWFYGPKACSQPLTFKSAATLQSATYSAGVLTIKVSIPATEAQMIQKGLGKASTQEAVTQIGQGAADDVKRLSERTYSQIKQDAISFIPQVDIDAAYLKYRAYQDTVGNWAKAHPTVGMIPRDYKIHGWIANNIGKAYSPRTDFLEVSEVASTPFPTAILPTPTWSQAWPYVATVGIIVAIIIVAFTVG